MNKNDVAQIQLERAMRLFLEEEDYISAITLAGAAEEILGKQIKDRPNALDEYVGIIEKLLAKCSEQSDKKAIGDYLNYPRNSLKHLKVGDRQDFNFQFKEAASELIERAILNYLKVTSYFPDEDLYKAFIEQISGSPNSNIG